MPKKVKVKESRVTKSGTRVANPYPELVNPYLKEILTNCDAEEAQMLLDSPSRVGALRRAGYSDLEKLRNSGKAYSPKIERAIIELGEELAIKKILELYAYSEKIGDTLSPKQKALIDILQEMETEARHEARLQKARFIKETPRKPGRPSTKNVVIPS